MRKVITLAASAAVALSLFGCASSLPNTAKAGNGITRDTPTGGQRPRLAAASRS